MATELEVKARERKELLDEIRRRRAAAAQAEGSVRAAEEGQYGDVGQGGPKGEFDDEIDQDPGNEDPSKFSIVSPEAKTAIANYFTTAQPFGSVIGTGVEGLARIQEFLADKQIPFTDKDVTDIFMIISQAPDREKFTKEDIGKVIGMGEFVTEDMVGQNKPLTITQVPAFLGNLLFGETADTMQKVRDEGLTFDDMTAGQRLAMAAGSAEATPLGFAPDIYRLGKAGVTTGIKAIDELTKPLVTAKTADGMDLNINPMALTEDQKARKREIYKEKKEGTFEDPRKVRINSIEEGLNEYLELNYKKNADGVYEVDRNWKANAVPFLNEKYGGKLIYKNEPFTSTKLTQLIKDNPTKLKQFNVVVKKGNYRPTDSFYSFYSENFNDVINRADDITDSRTVRTFQATNPEFRFLDFIGKTRRDLYSSVATKDGTDFSKLVEEYDPRKLNDPNYKHYQAFQRFAFLDEARIEANEFIKPILKKIFTDTDRQSLQIAHKYESSGIATGYVDKAKAGTGGDIFEMYIDFSQINQGVQRTLETEARKLVGKYNKALLDEKPVDNILKEINKIHEKMVDAGVQGQAYPFVLGAKDPTPISTKITNLIKNAQDQGIKFTQKELEDAEKAVDILLEAGQISMEKYGTIIGGLAKGGLVSINHMTRPLGF